MTDPGTYLFELIDWASGRLQGDEVLTASFTGEDADFVRFNRAAVRQAGSVQQRELSVDLIEGQRHGTAHLQLAGSPDLDRPRLARVLTDLRDRRRSVPEDPHLLYATDSPSTQRSDRSDRPDPMAAVSRILEGAPAGEPVGVYAAGESYAGFASSLGQRNWHETTTFNVDWSLHLRADKAVKASHAGLVWDEAAFDRKVDRTVRQLEALDRRPIELSPGRYRTYLAPTALNEVMDLLAWGGFGLKAHRTRQTPLLRMVTEGATLAPEVRISEATAAGFAPPFQAQGFARPDEVVLVDGGRYVGWLVSPRSAREYGVPTNGADDWEAPRSVALAPGSLPAASVLDELGTGLYVANLWYGNYSDRAAGRITGMTRFATFWVERGEIVGPVNVLRFDDTVFDLLGDGLVGLTDEAEVLLDPSTYGQRSTASATLPGALIDGMTFTL